MQKTWKIIPGFIGKYSASSCGLIRRNEYVAPRVFKNNTFYRTYKTKIIVGPSLSGRGYKRVNLDYRNYFVHTLVAKAFLHKKHRALQINHKNGIKTDNRVCNLEWVTQEQNRLHAIETGLLDYIKNAKKVSKLNMTKVRKIRSLYKNGFEQLEIGKMFGVKQQCISRVLARQTWKHVK